MPHVDAYFVHPGVAGWDDGGPRGFEEGGGGGGGESPRAQLICQEK